METKQAKVKVVVSLLVLCGLLVFSLFAVAGDSEPVVPETQGDDMFLWIDGIPGESMDDVHRDWIEVLSYSHCVSQLAAGAVGSGGSRTAERSEHCDFSIVKTLDKASPKLALFCCNAGHIPVVRFELCRAVDKQKFMEYTFRDVIITSVRPESSIEGGHTRPLEEVSFSYGKIEWTYTEFHADGRPKGVVSAHWDLVANKGG